MGLVMGRAGDAVCSSGLLYFSSYLGARASGDRITTTYGHEMVVGQRSGVD